MKLSDLKAKGADKLNEEEIAVLKRNEDKLSDEDKEFFADALKEEELEAEEGLTFKSEDDLDKWLEERDQKKQEAEEEAKRQREAEEKGEMFFEKPPKDWNDAFRTATPKIIETYEKKRQAQLEEQRKKIDEINKQFDQEIEDLKKGGEEIPEAGTKERQEFDKELAKVASETPGVNSMTAAYKIYKADKVLAETNKGQEPPATPPATPPAKPPVSPTQKSVAQKMGKSGGSSAKGDLKYSDVKSKSMDELMEEAMDDLE